MPIERKYERDIDLLLAEEFAVAPHFANWFLGHTRFAGSNATVEDVFVSRTDGTGESDLVVIFTELSVKNRFVLLIEDKIDASLQPDQVERYELHGQLTCARGEYDAFEIVLCACECTDVPRRIFGPDSARIRIPEDHIAVEHLIEYSSDEPPVFAGHYWMDTEPSVLAPKVACLDYSRASPSGGSGTSPNDAA